MDVECVAPQSDMTNPGNCMMCFKSRSKVELFSQAHDP
jgi:hypothetical protein